MMNILLTGSTGFLGFRTLEKLVQISDIGYIIATGRNLDDSRKINHTKVKYVLGDLSNKDFVATLFDKIDVVVNTASLSAPWGSKESFHLSNVITQENMIKAAEDAKVKRFIYISSPSIYYNGKHRRLIKESDPLPVKFINHYAETKKEAETLLRKSNLNHIIIRPRAIIGRGDTVIMPRLIRAYSEGKLKIIGDGNNYVDLTSVENVVESIRLSIYASEEALNHSYNITDGNPVKLWDSINFVLEGIGKQKVEKKVPFKLAYIAAFISEIISKNLTHKDPAITRYSAGVLSKNFTLDITKSKRLLNYMPKVSTNQSIQEFINWYQKKEHEGG